MAKVISQETFDSIVKDNIIEFDMDIEEARQETIKQLESQDVNLENIIKDLNVNTETGRPLLDEAMEILMKYADKNEKAVELKAIFSEEFLLALKCLEDQCDKSIAHRLLAVKYGAHDLLLQLLTHQNRIGDPETALAVIATLKALNALYDKNPDIFNAKALSLLIQLMGSYVTMSEDESREKIVSLIMKCLQKVCLMHELNRHNIMNANIVKFLKLFLKSASKSNKVLLDIFQVLRNLVLDDDIRVEFGCAHEHARMIANEMLVDLTYMLEAYDDTVFLSDLLLTISTMAVRAEFCAKIAEIGGISFIFKTMVNNPYAVRMNYEALRLLRILAGHDEIKNQIAQKGLVAILEDVFKYQIHNENVMTAALGCISNLTLRNQENSRLLFDSDIPEKIVEAMRRHSKCKTVQRNGAWAIRNMVSRSRDQCKAWLSHGIEDVLITARNEHPTIEQDIKAALRDLGCNVELKEEFTGVAEKKILNNME